MLSFELNSDWAGFFVMQPHGHRSAEMSDPSLRCQVFLQYKHGSRSLVSKCKNMKDKVEVYLMIQPDRI